MIGITNVHLNQIVSFELDLNKAKTLCCSLSKKPDFHKLSRLGTRHQFYYSSGLFKIEISVSKSL